MKKVLLAIIALGVSVGAFAQVQPLGFGFKAGLNFPKYHFSEGLTSDVTTNFHVTAFLEAPVANYLYVQPGISLQGKGGGGDNMFGHGVDYKQNTMWLEVPVNLVAKMPVAMAGQVFVGAGPYVGFGLSGENKVTNGGSSISTDFNFGKDKDLKGVDFGLNFIAGYQLNNGLMIHGGYGLGLTNLTPNGMGDFKTNNRVWTVGLGFAL